MSRQPTPEEAALALGEVRRRGSEALTARREPMWLQIAWTVVILGCFASYDAFDDPGAAPWIVPLGLVMLQTALSSTRHGAGLLGLRSVGPHTAPAHRVAAFTAIVVLTAAAGAAVFWLGRGSLDAHVPYWHTLAGLVGLTLVVLVSRRTTALQRRLPGAGSKGNA